MSRLSPHWTSDTPCQAIFVGTTDTPHQAVCVGLLMHQTTSIYPLYKVIQQEILYQGNIIYQTQEETKTKNFECSTIQHEILDWNYVSYRIATLGLLLCTLEHETCLLCVTRYQCSQFLLCIVLSILFSNTQSYISCR